MLDALKHICKSDVIIIDNGGAFTSPGAYARGLGVKRPNARARAKKGLWLEQTAREGRRRLNVHTRNLPDTF